MPSKHPIDCAIPYYTLPELTSIFGCASDRMTRLYIKQGRFPVPTYRVMGRHVADISVVTAFFQQHRDDSWEAAEAMMAEINAGKMPFS